MYIDLSLDLAVLEKGSDILWRASAELQAVSCCQPPPYFDEQLTARKAGAEGADKLSAIGTYRPRT